MKTFVLTGMSVMLLTGCAIDGHNPRIGVGVSAGGPPSPPVVVAKPSSGPPPWAQAHGRRAMVSHRYQYYPSTGVYFNVATGSYFYMNGGTWQVAMSLPSTLVIDRSDYITMELETDRPYLFYDEHRVKYKGPKHVKERGHGRGGQGRWKEKD